MRIIAEIRARVCESWLASRCRSGRLSVGFTGEFGNRLLVDLDRVRPRLQGPICDYLFFGHNMSDDKLWVVPVEFKAGKPDPAKVIRQLSGGARYAERLLGGHRTVVSVGMLVFGGTLRGEVAEAFKNDRISLFQESRRILYTRNRATLPKDAPRPTG